MGPLIGIKSGTTGSKKKKVKVCAYFIVDCFGSLTVPGAQLMLVQPFANDAGHLHNVGEIMQKDVIIFDEGQWMESGLQAAQPINGRGLALLAYSHRENQLLQQIKTQYVCVCVCIAARTCSSLMVMR